MASRLKQTKKEGCSTSQCFSTRRPVNYNVIFLPGYLKTLTADTSVELDSEFRLDDAGPSCRDDADVPRRDRQGVAGVTAVECLRHTFIWLFSTVIFAAIVLLLQ